MQLEPLHTKKYIAGALKNQNLRRAIARATDTVIASSAKVVGQIPYWELLRSKIYSVKKDVIEHLDDYLIEFESNCIKNGIQVHWAIDAAEAGEVIVGIARARAVKKIVKSKSLTTEEINLNPLLQKHGIETVETDLGEYIVQLMGQSPSHLTMPALHLSRQDIGRLFHTALGIDYTEEPAALLAVARARLREHFLNADMGISGVNFAIADSGCFCVIENEANAHLTMCLPKIHVAVMGMEKLLPDMKALPFFLKALAPRATGQKASTYVNFIGGPTSGTYGEGPEEVHLILLDNGRSRLLADPQLRETLFCIRCGACLNICPIYKQIGGHAYGWVYMGPIGIALLPQYLGERAGKYAPFLSSLCGACFEICPMRIQIPHHLLALRSRVVEAGESSRMERIGMSLWAYCARHPRLYRLVTAFPGRLQRLLPKGSAFPLPGYTRARRFACFDALGFRRRYMKMVKSASKRA